MGSMQSCGAEYKTSLRFLLYVQISSDLPASPPSTNEVALIRVWPAHVYSSNSPSTSTSSSSSPFCKFKTITLFFTGMGFLQCIYLKNSHNSENVLTCFKHWSTCSLSSSLVPIIFSLHTGQIVSSFAFFFLPLPRATKQAERFLIKSSSLPTPDNMLSNFFS